MRAYLSFDPNVTQLIIKYGWHMRYLKLFSFLALFTIVSCKGDTEIVNGGWFKSAKDIALDTGNRLQFTPTINGPLSLIAAVPFGTMQHMDGVQAISVSFSKPMVAIGASSDNLPEGQLQISPSVSGKLRWEGTQTLVFQPEKPLPNATGYKVVLRKGLKALNGESLKEDFEWAFETPRPSMVYSEPADGAEQVSNKPTIFVRFNQGMAAGTASGYVSLRMKDGGTVGTRVEKKGDSTLVIRPTETLSKGRTYQVVLAKGLRGKEGGLGMEAEDTVSFTTFPDLALLGASQNTYYDEASSESRVFDPARGISLNFSTPVKFGALRKALTFSPAVRWPVGIEARDNTEATSHNLPMQWLPETNYTATVRGLADIHGQTLGNAEITFKTKAFSPFADMKSGLMVIESNQRTFIPIRSVNVPSVKVGMQRIRADQVVPLIPVYDEWRYYDVDESQKPKPIEATSDYKLNLPRNQIGATPLDLSSVLSNKKGVVAVAMKVKTGPKPEDERTATALAQVSNMAVTGKFSPHQNLIVVTELQTAKPVPNAKVTIRDAQNNARWSGTTDAQGRALSPGWARLGIPQKEVYSEPIQYAIVEKDGDLAFTASNMDDGIEPYRFDISYGYTAKKQSYAGSIFSDRGLYRAGEKVHLKGVFRKRLDKDWQLIKEPLRVLIYGPKNDIVYDQRLSPSDFGTLDFDWMSSPGADQGEYTMRAILASDTTNVTEYYGYESNDVGKGTFRIDSFRRATFAVTARPNAKSYIAGDFYDATISGRYLFGAAMAGQPLKYRLDQEPTDYTPPGYEDYRFGVARYGLYDSDYGSDPMNSLYTTLAQVDSSLTLGGDGMAKFRVPLKGNGLGTPVKLTLEATVTDPARQESMGGSRVVVHPGLFYVGLKPQTTFLELGKSSAFSLDVITVDPNGFPVSGDVNVQLIKQEYNSVREVGVDGAMRWRSNMREDTKGTAKITTEAGKAKRLNLDVPEAGFYVVRATGRDIRGNLVRSESYFYATGGSGYVGWERRDDNKIEVVADHKTYAPGQTARLMIASPYETCTALITIEREGILSSRVETLTGSAPMIDIPLTEEHLPNAFVSVMLFSGRTAAPTNRNDVGAPSFKIGYIQLNVDPGLRHLKVAVEPTAKNAKPGEEVTVNLKVTDENGAGVAGEIAFSAADAGVLNLLDYKLPDPFEAFYGARDLQVRTSDTRSILLLQRDYGDKEEDVGGGGGNGGDVRRDFRPQAYWNPKIRTDGSGRATIKFKLPESLTTFRLMAVAITQNHRFGMGSEDVVVSKPLVLTPALPRFARLNDQFEGGVLVTNTTGKDGNATVTAFGENGLQLTGSSTQSVYLKNGETKEVRFAWKTAQTGNAKITFRAALGNEKDAFQTQLSLQQPSSKLAFGTFASTDGTAQEAFLTPAAFSSGTIRTRLASTALVGLDGATQYLFEYPYGCLEQRTSRIRPLLLGQDVLAAFDLKALKGNDAQTVTTQWVNNLRDYWLGDGFSLWAGDRELNPYVTAYTLLAMKEAQDAGFTVQPDMVNGATTTLAEYIRNSDRKPEYYPASIWPDTRAMMLFALARHGKVLSGELYTLAEQANSGKAGLSADGLNHLIRAIHLSKDSNLNKYKWALLNKVRGNIRMEATSAYIAAPTDNAWGWLFASNTRSTALGLISLIELDPSDATRQVAEKMIRYLMQNRKQGWWASTQDNATVVEAFAKYYKAFEKESPNFSAEVKMAGQSLMRQTFSGRTLNVAEQTRTLGGFGSNQNVPVQVSKSGTGRLFYSLLMEAYTTQPLAAAANGLTVSRTIERLNDRGQTVGTVSPDANGNLRLKPGELVKVTLRVQTNATRNYVVVDDALPAGLEALNAAFVTTSSAATANTGQSNWWGSFNHTEIRDDRVLLFADYMGGGEHTYSYAARATSLGTFVYPPVSAEAMYQPEVNGRTRTLRLTVAN